MRAIHFKASSWTIERTLRGSILLIASMAVLLMAFMPWKLARDAGEVASRELTEISVAAAHSTHVQFYVTPAFIEQPTHLKLIETPHSTLAASIDLVARSSWLDGLQDKLMIMGLIATIVVLAASVIGARLTNRRVSASIEELTETVKKLRNGEKVAPPSSRMPSEIKALASTLLLAFDERSAALHKVQSLAHYDGLTGALSRAYFDHRARNLLQIAMRTKDPATLLYIDLDRFKNINDAYGHDAGDLLLQTVVTRARQRLRSIDLIGRRGGDEFVVFLPQMTSPDAIADLARDLADLITAPVEIDGETVVRVGVSMGAAVFPDDAEKYDALVTCADKAMYEAKKAGRGRLSFPSGAIIELASIEWREESGAA